MARRFLSILMSLVLCIGLMPLPAFAGDSSLEAGSLSTESLVVQFSPDNFKASITKLNIGAPITGTDGKKYLPVTATFTAKENIGSDGLVDFLEGYVKATLANGTTSESVAGVGMTLMGPAKPDVPLDNNMYSWEWNDGTGTGVLKYNIPLLENDETQSVETSQTTGLSEANGLKVGDQATLQIETVIKGVPADISVVRGDEFTFTVEDASKYPKEIKKGETPEPQDPKNVAIAKMVTSDGKVSASQTVSWPKSQASVSFRPGSLEGYSVSPTEHVFTTDGEVFTFTYTPTGSVEASVDTTVTVNYMVLKACTPRREPLQGNSATRTKPSPSATAAWRWSTIMSLQSQRVTCTPTTGISRRACPRMLAISLGRVASTMRGCPGSTRLCWN